MKSLIKERAEVIVTSMYAAGTNIPAATMAEWLEVKESSMGTILGPLMKRGLLKKIGAGRNTSYSLGENIENYIKKASSTDKDIVQAVRQCIQDAFGVKEEPKPVEFIHTSEGKILKKAHKGIAEKLPEYKQQAVNNLLEILSENEGMVALKDKIRKLEEEVDMVWKENAELKQKIANAKKALC